MNNIKTNVLFFTLLAFIFMAFVAISWITPLDACHWLVHRYALDSEKAMALHLYIGETTWLKMKTVLLVVALVLLYLFFKDRFIFKAYKTAWISWWHAVKADFKSITRIERIILLFFMGVYTCALLFYSHCTPLQLDELHSWLFFVDRGPLVTMVLYPSNNNHIAYNLLTCFWNIFLSPVWAMRMTSLLSAIGVVFFVYLILRRRYTAILSFAGLLLLMGLAPFAWYAVQGRGYVLELFGLIMVLYLLVQEAYDESTDRLLVFWNAFTLYVVPVALIPLLVLNGFYAYRMIKNKKNNAWRVIKTGMYTAVLTFLLYTPVWIVSGFSQLLNNPFVQRIAHEDSLSVAFIEYGPKLWNFITGCDEVLNVILLITLLLLSSILLLMRERTVLMPMALLFLPLLLLQLYPVLLFERTWVWLVIPLVWWVLEVTYVFLLVRWWIGYAFIILLVIAMSSANVFRLYRSNVLLVQHAQQFSTLREIVETKLSGKILRVYDDTPYTYFKFYQKEKGNYNLLYNQESPFTKAGAVLDSKRHFHASKGTLLWAGEEEVLYIPN